MSNLSPAAQPTPDPLTAPSVRTADLRRMEQQGQAVGLFLFGPDTGSDGTSLRAAAKLAQNFCICFAFVAPTLMLWSYVY